MLVTIGALVALNLQVQIGPSRRRPPTVRDSTDSATAASGRRRNSRNIRKPVTAEVLATAYKDPTAKITLLHARGARLTQDSSLTAYDAMSYQRISAGMGFTKIGRDRLIFRHESAARVQWQSGKGVWMEARGQRTALPMISNAEARKEINDEMGGNDVEASIPYYPGYEPLWVGSNVARAQVDESEFVDLRASHVAADPQRLVARVIRDRRLDVVAPHLVVDLFPCFGVRDHRKCGALTSRFHPNSFARLPLHARRALVAEDQPIAADLREAHAGRDALIRHCVVGRERGVLGEPRASRVE